MLKNLDVWFVLALTSSVFYYIFLKCGFSVELGDIYGDYDSDIPYHVYAALNGLRERSFFKGNFLLYLLINLLSGFSMNFKLKGMATCLLLGMAEAATYTMFREQFQKRGVPHTSSILLAISMLLVFVIPYTYYLGLLGFSDADSSRYMYYAYYVPTVWHNSTIIFSMPFSLALFLLSESALKICRLNTIWKMCIIVALDVFVKPSFFFIFLIGFSVVAFARYRFSKDFIRCMFPVVVGTLCMLYVFLSIYGDTSDDSGVQVSFAKLLQLDHFGWYKIAASLAFPVLFVVFRWRKIDRDFFFLYVLLLLASAIGISLVCVETGPRANHGNFYWQVIPAMQLTYFFILRNLVMKKTETQKERIVGEALMVLFSLHVLSGIWYLARYVLFGIYS